ncbi:MAG: hypothetical protein LBH44_11985 [Treponema sp.]|nr:hypothetical protein [Treponema sp.]
MANKKSWLGMLVMVLVFGMMIVGCDDDNPNLDSALFGTWEHADGRVITFNRDGTFTFLNVEDNMSASGTWSTSNGIVYINYSGMEGVAPFSYTFINGDLVLGGATYVKK